MPFIFSDAKKTIGQMFIAYIFELPATIIVFFLIDSKRWGGRKLTFNLGLIAYIMIELIMYQYRENSLIFGMVIIRVTDKICWLALH